MERMLSWHGHFIVLMVEVWKSEVLLYVLVPRLTTPVVGNEYESE